MIVGSRESVRLAFLAAPQHLPPRQRAVFVLRWKAAEVADAIGTTTAAVNSLSPRARAQLYEVSPSQDDKIVAIGQPAAAMYTIDADSGRRLAFQLHLVDVKPGGISHVVAFRDGSLFAKFGLPESLSGRRLPVAAAHRAWT